MRTSFFAEALRCCVLLSLLLCAAANRRQYFHSTEGNGPPEDVALAFDSVPQAARTPGPEAGFWALSSYDLMLREPQVPATRNGSSADRNAGATRSVIPLYFVGDMYKKP